MRIAPQERVIYEQKLLNTARDYLEAEAEEMRKRGRSDWSLELAGSFPETEVVVTYTDAAGRAVDRRFPIWNNDYFGLGDERDGPREAGWLLALNVYSTTPR